MALPMTELSSDELRFLVREALREALPSLKAGPTPDPATSSFISRLRTALGGSRRLEVPVSTAEDLGAFARDVIRAAEHADLKAAIMSGRIAFSPAQSHQPKPAQRGTHRLDKGVLTEAMVIEFGRVHGRIVLGKDVAVTPLARDRAREAKLEIVRDKP